MKDTHFLYAVFILGVVAITAVFAGYATGTLPTNTPQQLTTTPAASRTITTEKRCSCCKANLAKFREFMEARKRRKAAAELESSAQSSVAK